MSVQFYLRSGETLDGTAADYYPEYRTNWNQYAMYAMYAGTSLGKIQAKKAVLNTAVKKRGTIVKSVKTKKFSLYCCLLLSFLV